ncbi:MAG: hypothetical protein RIT15_1070 [Pseudomonadota bacterium]
MEFTSALFRFFFKKRDWSRKYLLKRLKHMIDMLLNVFLIRSTYKSLSALKAFDQAKLFSVTQRVISGNYCSKNFSLSEKLKTALHHYRTIDSRFSNGFLPTEQSQASLWEHVVNSRRYDIRLTCSDYPAEGELSLLLFVDNVAIYTISFTFIDASLKGVNAAKGSSGMLIGRVQGVKDTKPLVHITSKDHFQSYPSFLLYAALQGVAKTMNRQFIVGVCAECCLSFGAVYGNYHDAYNAFWEKLDGKRISQSYFDLPLVLPEKNFNAVSGHHRKRAIGRHELKINIADQVAQRLSTYLVSPSVKV